MEMFIGILKKQWWGCVRGAQESTERVPPVARAGTISATKYSIVLLSKV